MHSHGPCLAHSPVNAVDRRRSRRDDSCSHVNPSRLSLSFLFFSFFFFFFFSCKAKREANDESLARKRR